MYSGSKFQEVRDQVWSDPYDGLPIQKIASKNYFKNFSNLLYRAAKRTVRVKADLLPRFDKLIHANGIAFTGYWEITEENPYTGHFKKGSQALLIARASVILSETTADYKRGFGFAGKIFPTLDTNEQVHTADFLMLDSFVGSPARFYSDVGISNHPVIGMGWNIAKYFGVLATTLASFPWADLPLTYRPVFKVASIGVSKEEDIKSPTWLMVKARADSRIEDKMDFREEIAIANQKEGKLILDVHTSESKRKKGKRPWTRIGKITLTESILSDSCDHRLHFHHPKVRGTKWKP